MNDAIQALINARAHLAETIPEPTERQRWALDDLDRAIERVEAAAKTRDDAAMPLFGSER